MNVSPVYDIDELSNDKSLKDLSKIVNEYLDYISNNKFDNTNDMKLTLENSDILYKFKFVDIRLTRDIALHQHDDILYKLSNNLMKSLYKILRQIKFLLGNFSKINKLKTLLNEYTILQELIIKQNILIREHIL